MEAGAIPAISTKYIQHIGTNTRRAMVSFLYFLFFSLLSFIFFTFFTLLSFNIGQS